MQITKTATQQEKKKKKSVEFHEKEKKKGWKHEWSQRKASEKMLGQMMLYMKVSVDVVPQMDYILVHDLRWDFEGWG